jgi:hypothetical protein
MGKNRFMTTTLKEYLLESSGIPLIVKVIVMEYSPTSDI